MRYLLLLVNISILVCICAASYSPSTSNSNGWQVSSTSSEINAKYGTSDKAATLRNSIPRWGHSKDFSTDDDYDYFIGVATLAGPGVALAVIVIIWMFVFCCCRCCGRCGAGRAPTMGWSLQQKYTPLAITFVFIAAAIAFTGIGLYYNQQLSKGISSDDEGIGSVAIKLIDELYTFSDVIKGQMNLVVNEVPYVVSNVTTYLNRAGVLAVGTTGLINSLAKLGTNMGGLQIVVPGEAPISSITYTCDYCTDVSTTIANIVSEMRSKADPVFADMNNTVNDIKDTVLDIKNEIISQVADAASQIDDVRGKSSEYNDKAVDYNDDVKKYDGYREIAGIVILCFPFLWLILVLTGVPTKMTGFLTCNFVHIWFISFLMFILLAVHLPLAAVTGDSCVYIDEKQGNLSSSFDHQVANVINACLLNTSLVEALNITQQLDFANLITFPDLPSINQSFSFSSLDTFVDEVAALDVSTFGYIYNSTADLKRINDITTVYGDVWAESNISQCDPWKYYNPAALENVPTVNVSRAIIIVNTRAFLILNSTVWSMKHNVSAILAQKLALQAQTDAFQSDFALIKASINPLIDIVKETEDLAYCGFVGTAYAQIKSSYCSTTVEALSFLALSFFLLGVFAQGVAGGSILLAQRYKKDDHDFDESNDWASSKPAPNQHNGTALSPSAVSTPAAAGGAGATFVMSVPTTDFGALSVSPPSAEMQPIAGQPGHQDEGALTYVPAASPSETGGSTLGGAGSPMSAKAAPDLPLPIPPSSSYDGEPDPYSTPLPPPAATSSTKGVSGAALEF